MEKNLFLEMDIGVDFGNLGGGGGGRRGLKVGGRKLAWQRRKTRTCRESNLANS